jgi:hypothetical protein
MLLPTFRTTSKNAEQIILRKYEEDQNGDELKQTHSGDFTKVDGHGIACQPP